MRRGERLSRRDCRFDILSQAAVAVDPGKEALDDLLARVCGEADLSVDLAHDLDPDGACRHHARALVARIGIG